MNFKASNVFNIYNDFMTDIKVTVFQDQQNLYDLQGGDRKVRFLFWYRETYWF